MPVRQGGFLKSDKEHRARGKGRGARKSEVGEDKRMGPRKVHGRVVASNQAGKVLRREGETSFSRHVVARGSTSSRRGSWR